MMMRMLTHRQPVEAAHELHIAPEPTEAQKKRARFGTMFTLHALFNRAGIRHENEHTLICSGYVKTRDRF